mmetsp:Transcript_39719/g.51236  ORF Transcript_39719/g.51236 Transcript_39719/m.51236 type:complete len:493 (-) Transcript_39719:45-1523(-)
MPFYAGVEGGGQSWRVAISEDHPANIIRFKQIKSVGKDPYEVLDEIKSFLDEAKYDALGISTFGPIDTDPASNTFGFILGTPNKALWKNIDVVGYLWDRKVPCRFHTDVSAPAFAESLHGKAIGGSCAYITVGTGVGAGFVVNGKVLSGLVQSECGHTPISSRPGFGDESEVGACKLHKGGCVSGVASGQGISFLAGVALSELGSICDDHPVWDRAAHALGALCYNIAMYISPEKIILNGGVMQREILYDKVRSEFRRLGQGLVCHPLFNDRLDEYIVPSTWGQNAGIVGALTVGQSALEQQYFFEDTMRFRSLQTALSPLRVSDLNVIPDAVVPITVAPAVLPSVISEQGYAAHPPTLVAAASTSVFPTKEQLPIIEEIEQVPQTENLPSNALPEPIPVIDQRNTSFECIPAHGPCATIIEPNQAETALIAFSIEETSRPPQVPVAPQNPNQFKMSVKFSFSSSHAVCLVSVLFMVFWLPRVAFESVTQSG